MSRRDAVTPRQALAVGTDDGGFAVGDRLLDQISQLLRRGVGIVHCDTTPDFVVVQVHCLTGRVVVLAALVRCGEFARPLLAELLRHQSIRVCMAKRVGLVVDLPDAIGRREPRGRFGGRLLPDVEDVLDLGRVGEQHPNLGRGQLLSRYFFPGEFVGQSREVDFVRAARVFADLIPLEDLVECRLLLVFW